MDYTICSKVINEVKNTPDQMVNLLYNFITGDIHRVVLNDKILEEYENIGKNNNEITTWIKLLSQLNKYVTEPCDLEPIFIETCKKSDDKLLIVNKRNDYNSYTGINKVLKIPEAISEIKPISKIINTENYSEGNMAVQKGTTLSSQKID